MPELVLQKLLGDLLKGAGGAESAGLIDVDVQGAAFLPDIPQEVRKGGDAGLDEHLSGGVLAGLPDGLGFRGVMGDQDHVHAALGQRPDGAFPDVSGSAREEAGPAR